MKLDSDYAVRLAILGALGGDTTKSYDSVYEVDLAILAATQSGSGPDIQDVDLLPEASLHSGEFYRLNSNKKVYVATLDEQQEWVWVEIGTGGEIVPLIQGANITISENVISAQVENVINDEQVAENRTWSSSKIDEELQSVAGTANSEFDGKTTEDFSFVTELPVSGEEGQQVIIKGENVDTLYKYVSDAWVEQTPDANILYFDTVNEALYSYITAEHQFAPISIVNTIVVGKNLNSNTALKNIKEPGVYNVLQRTSSTTKGEYTKKWTLTVEGVDYDEYELTDSVYQRIQSNYTIQKRTWSSSRQTNDGWSSFSTYYAGEIKDSTTSKYYTWSSNKLNTELGTKQDALTAGQNITIDANSYISAYGFVFDNSDGAFAIIYRQDQEDGGALVANTASGLGAVSEGYNTTASGDYGAHTEGSETHAYGSSSHAEGIATEANGTASHTEGYKSTASGQMSHAEGWQTTATANGAHAEGRQTTASGTYAHAEGRQTTASGHYSHAEGGLLDDNGTLYYTYATNFGSHAEGGATIASGMYAHAEGCLTEAAASNSHAEGLKSSASGNASHAEGRMSSASGDYGSHAEGNMTTASGEATHAEGWCTTAQNRGEHAEGIFNVSHTNNASNGETIHSTGIGNDANSRTNAVEIMANGDMYVYGVGDYQGTDTKVQDATIQTLQDVVNAKADATDLSSYATIAYVTNELANKANLSDLNSYATIAYVTNELAGKQDILTEGAHIDITNNVISVEYEIATTAEIEALFTLPSFYVDNTLFETYGNLTWTQWLASRYNTAGFTHIYTAATYDSSVEQIPEVSGSATPTEGGHYYSTCTDTYVPATAPADDEIWYTTESGNLWEPINDPGEGEQYIENTLLKVNNGSATILSNNYVNGHGVIKYSEPITSLDYRFGYNYYDGYTQPTDLTTLTLPNSITSVDDILDGSEPELEAIYYNGTVAECEEINWESFDYNQNLQGENVIICLDGTYSLSSDEGGGDYGGGY